MDIYGSYQAHELNDCVQRMLIVLREHGHSNALHKHIYEKYLSEKFFIASKFVENVMEAWVKGEVGPDPVMKIDD